MKKLSNYITEKLKIGNNINTYKYYPKTTDELDEIIVKLLKERGNDADLNDIDVSKITDMSEIFEECLFNGDISEWDVSNVKNMEGMFAYSDFNGDISKWDISNVEDMSHMFYESKFNGDISNWKINKNCNIEKIFNFCPLQNNPPKWYEKFK